jgi:hypothetical protein
MIAFESLIERDFIYLLDYEEDVEWFEEQPLTIEYEHEGKILHYTPDFHLIENGRDVLVECKPTKFVTNEENRRKALAACNWCALQDWVYRVVTEKQIRKGFRLQNVKLLTRFARQVVSPDVRMCIYALISNYQGQPSIESLVRTLSPENPSAMFAGILRMAFYHEICLPINDALISVHTRVSLPLRVRKESAV